MCSNIKKDYHRYEPSKNIFVNLGKIFHNPGIVFSFFYRIERYLMYESNSVGRIIWLILYPGYFFFTYHILSYHIEPNAKIGGWLFLHNRDIIITDNIEIWENFSIMGQTTIGTGFLRSGKITIWDNVFVWAWAKIIASSDISIESWIWIGANAVVVEDLDIENGVYVGIPAKFIKTNNNAWNNL